MDCPRFLQVLVDVAEELPVAAGGEVAHVEKALQTNAAKIRE